MAQRRIAVCDVNYLTASEADTALAFGMIVRSRLGTLFAFSRLDGMLESMSKDGPWVPSHFTAASLPNVSVDFGAACRLEAIINGSST